MSNPGTRVYYGPTTEQQRRHMIEVYETTGNISEACRQAKVSRGTFYRWYPRYLEGGWEAIKEPRSRTAHTHPNVQPLGIVQRVLDLNEEHPDWGRHRIANQINKEHNWEKVISGSTVRDILIREGRWPRQESKPVPETCSPSPESQELVTRHADEPGKTVNIDLCFVPVPVAEPVKTDGETAAASPAGNEEMASEVIATASPVENEEADASPSYPGEVFADLDLSYDEAMDAYADLRIQVEAQAAQAEEDPLKAERAALRTDEEALRIERRLLRQKRKKEDQDWRAYRQNRRSFKDWWYGLTAEAKAMFRHHKQTADAEWQRRRARRQAQMRERKAQDEQWRQVRQDIRQRKAALDKKARALALRWVAILVILDNCTRRCLALPLFVAGKHVTSEMVVAALRQVLPGSLRFLISDNGTQFIAQRMADLATEMGFRQVRISPRRAKTNGIAERFVRTLREMLAQYPWQTLEELISLLPEIVAEYNDRPHQGKELNGLSPNEYAHRLLAQAAQVA